MLKIDWRSYKIPLRRDLIMANSVNKDQELVVLALSVGDLVGFGDIPCSRREGYSAEFVSSNLAKESGWLESLRLDDLEASYIEKMLDERKIHWRIRSGLDTALCDLASKVRKESMWEMLEISRPSDILTTYTISEGDVCGVGVLGEEQWPILKFKVDGRQKDWLKRLHTVIGDFEGSIVLDANGSLQPEQVEELVSSFPNIRAIEEPLDPCADANSFPAALFHKTNVVADESWIPSSPIEEIPEYFTHINLKITKSGGPTRLKSQISKLDRAGLKVVLGSMGESNVGVAATTQFSAYCEWGDLDSALLMTGYLGEGIQINQGVIKYKPNFGHGGTFDFFRRK